MIAQSIPESILSSAIPAFLEDEYLQVSVGAIADCAHVSVGSIYHHFGDKAGLRDAVAKQLMDIFIGDYLAPPLEQAPTPTQRALDHCQAYIRFVEERKAEYELVTSISHAVDGGTPQSRYSEQLTARVAQHLGCLVELTIEGQESGEFREGDPGDIVLLTWSSLYGLCMLNRRYPGPIRSTTGRSQLSQLAERVVTSALTGKAPATLA